MILDRFRLDGSVALVSGASRGIGAACAVALAEAGADVVIGARDEVALASTAAAIEATGQRALTVSGDLSARNGLAQVVDQAVAEFGTIDVLVNNVGGAMPNAFLATSEDAFRSALDFNVTTAFNLTQLATPALLDGGGAVVNITSTAGSFALRGFAAYGVAKAALIHLTRDLAQDLAPKIRVNAVSPGAVATDSLAMVVESEELSAMMVDGTPMRRIGEPEDIAAAVVYLASPAASYVTGQVLQVSGGIETSNLPMPIPDL